MKKNDIFDGIYKYICYPISNNDVTTVFDRGLPIKNMEINTYSNTIAYDEKHLQEWLNSDYPYTFSSTYVCILKIPAYYFGYKKSEGEYTPCMPLIKTNFNYEIGEENYIIANLVLGIYNTKTKEYIENPKYDQFFNPNGLQFADEQIENMKAGKNPRIADYALARRNIPYWILLKQDEDARLLDPVIEYYGSFAHSKQYKRIRY